MPDDATFVFTNTMGVDTSIPDNHKVTSVQFQGPTDEGFGLNVLDEGETIDPGESKTFFLDTQGNPGDWQVKIQHNVYIVLDMTSWPAFQELNDVTAGQEYSWSWSIL
jgi:hypothetical protein